MNRVRHSFLALCLALLAIFSQLSLSQPAHAALGGLSAHICGQSDPGQAPMPHHGMDCLTCPLCANLASHTPLLATPPAVQPMAVAIRIRIARPAHAASLHVPAVAAAPPRGPPALT